jgi:hypothetical protein
MRAVAGGWRAFRGIRRASEKAIQARLTGPRGDGEQSSGSHAVRSQIRSLVSTCLTPDSTHGEVDSRGQEPPMIARSRIPIIVNRMARICMPARRFHFS